MTVGELNDRMTSAEFGEWITYAALEPFGSPRDDARAGSIAAVVANVNRGRDTPAFMPWNFFHEIAPPAPPKGSKLRRVFANFRKKGDDEDA